MTLINLMILPYLNNIDHEVFIWLFLSNHSFIWIIGYGDIVPTNDLETIFSTITILFGGLVLPAIVGGLAAYMGNLNMAVTIHKKKIGKIRSYMRKSHLEFSLIDKVLRFYDYLWSQLRSLVSMKQTEIDSTVTVPQLRQAH